MAKKATNQNDKTLMQAAFEAAGYEDKYGHGTAPVADEPAKADEPVKSNEPVVATNVAVGKKLRRRRAMSNTPSPATNEIATVVVSNATLASEDGPVFIRPELRRQRLIQERDAKLAKDELQIRRTRYIEHQIQNMVRYFWEALDIYADESERALEKTNKYGGYIAADAKRRFNEIKHEIQSYINLSVFNGKDFAETLRGFQAGEFSDQDKVSAQVAMKICYCLWLEDNVAFNFDDIYGVAGGVRYTEPFLWDQSCTDLGILRHRRKAKDEETEAGAIELSYNVYCATFQEEIEAVVVAALNEKDEKDGSRLRESTDGVLTTLRAAYDCAKEDFFGGQTDGYSFKDLLSGRKGTIVLYSPKKNDGERTIQPCQLRLQVEKGMIRLIDVAGTYGFASHQNMRRFVENGAAFPVKTLSESRPGHDIPSEMRKLWWSVKSAIEAAANAEFAKAEADKKKAEEDEALLAKTKAEVEKNIAWAKAEAEKIAKRLGVRVVTQDEFLGGKYEVAPLCHNGFFKDMKSRKEPKPGVLVPALVVERREGKLGDEIVLHAATPETEGFFSQNGGGITGHHWREDAPAAPEGHVFTGLDDHPFKRFLVFLYKEYENRRRKEAAESATGN